MHIDDRSCDVRKVKKTRPGFRSYPVHINCPAHVGIHIYFFNIECGEQTPGALTTKASEGVDGRKRDAQDIQYDYET